MGWTFLGSHEKIITSIIAISGQRFPTIFNPIKTCRNMYDFLTFKANGFGVTSAEDSCLLVRSPVNVGRLSGVLFLLLWVKYILAHTPEERGTAAA